MAKRLVIFTKNNARVLTQPETFTDLMHYPNCVPDPDLMGVKGIPPHFWKLEEGLVVPMTEAEKDARMFDIEANGVDNEIKWIGDKPETEAKPFEVVEVIDQNYFDNGPNYIVILVVIFCALMAFSIYYFNR